MTPDKELFKKIDFHLLHDEAPSIFLNSISNEPEFLKSPFDMLLKLQTTEQSPLHHPEGNVWNHTLLVVDEAARIKSKSKYPSVFMWAALLHDIGKPAATKSRKGKITSYDHDKIGEKLSIDFLSKFTTDNEFIDSVSLLIRFHMQLLYVLKDLPYADIKSMKEKTDVDEVALLCLCDRLGRTGYDRVKEKNNIELFLRKVQ